MGQELGQRQYQQRSVNAAQSAYGTARYGAARYTGGLDAMDRPRGISKGATLHAQFRYDSEGRRK